MPGALADHLTLHTARSVPVVQAFSPRWVRAAGVTVVCTVREGGSVAALDFVLLNLNQNHPFP